MNWFERYGIVGSSSIALAFLYLKIFLPWIFLKRIELFLGVGVLFVLPCGYFISIFAQLLIYSHPLQRFHIHKNLLRFLLKRGFIIQGEKPLSKWSEVEAEAWLAMLHRIPFHKESDQKLHVIWEWARKRWDVLAINASLILSTCLFIFEACVTSLFYYVFSVSYDYFLYSISIWTVMIMTAIIYFNRYLLMQQLLLAYQEIFEVFMPTIEKPTLNAQELYRLTI